MPYKAVIFDFNGVLVDDEDLHFELMQTLAANYDVKLTREEYFSKVIGFDDQESFQYLLGSKVSGGEIQKLIAEKNRMYLETIFMHDILFPGTRDVVRQVAASHICAINSGALKVEIEAVLSNASLQRFFEVIVSANDLQHSKPHPQGYEMAFAKLKQRHPQLEKSQCLVIEDTPAGIQSAQVAGLSVVAITNSFSEEQLTAGRPLKIIKNLNELLLFLR